MFAFPGEYCFVAFTEDELCRAGSAFSYGMPGQPENLNRQNEVGNDRTGLRSIKSNNIPDNNSQGEFMTDLDKRKSIANEIWLIYFNQVLYSKAIITEKEKNKMILKIAAKSNDRLDRSGR